MTNPKRQFRLLVCSANMGNAEPNEESIRAWLPEDGAFYSVVERDSYKPQSTSPTGRVRFKAPPSPEEELYFDLIVIGMQEATFDNTTTTTDREASSKDLLLTSPEKLLMANPVTKGVEKVGTQVLGAVQQLAGSKDHVKKNKLPNVDVGGTKILHAAIEKRLPSYEWLVAYQRGQMRMIVLKRNNTIHDMVVSHVKAENTGLASVAANKGGILASILVNGTRFGFISAHLQAHEGAHHYQGRCSNLAEILNGTSTSTGGFSYDASLTHHYCFVCGDLNFRIVPDMINNTQQERNMEEDSIPQSQEENNSNSITLSRHSKKTNSSDHKKREKQQDMAKVRELVSKQDWPSLNSADELHHALVAKDCLVGFQTPPCHFPPTFKMERQVGFEYKSNRTPSYTDRILWKSTHQLQDRVKPLKYEPIEAFETSDHKPIRGAFEITLNPEIKLHSDSQQAQPQRRKSVFGQQSTPSSQDNLHLFFNELSCFDLKSKSPANQPDPYITFVSTPKELVQKELTKWQKIKIALRISSRTKKKESESGVVERTSRGWTRTSRKSSCTNPDWSGEEVHLIMKNSVEKDLTGALLFLTVHDDKSVLEDNVIGTFCLNLAQLYLSSKQQAASLSSSLQQGNNRRPSLFRRSSIKLDRGTSFRRHSSLSNDLRTIDIDEPLVKNGKQQGRIRCSIDTWWFGGGFQLRSSPGSNVSRYHAPNATTKRKGISRFFGKDATNSPLRQQEGTSKRRAAWTNGA